MIRVLILLKLTKILIAEPSTKYILTKKLGVLMMLTCKRLILRIEWIARKFFTKFNSYMTLIAIFLLFLRVGALKMKMEWTREVHLILLMRLRKTLSQYSRKSRATNGARLKLIFRVSLRSMITSKWAPMTLVTEKI